MSPKIEPLQIRDDKVLEALFNNKITEIKENTFSRIFKERVAFVLQDKRDIEFVELTLKLLVLVASSLYLLNYFTWIHYGLHIVLHVNLATSYVLMLHCVNHKQTYKSDYFYLNWIVPYFIAPFLGQTWTTFYYHHVKHHHIEDNGPNDLSSTLLYERDNVFHFIYYFLRFFLLIGIELPIYFLRKQWYTATILGSLGEYLSLALFATITYYKPLQGVLLFWLPFTITRFGMMSGNWAQHAFIHPSQPKNDYVQSLTCINTQYNDNAFNDGYHTSHHLNPIRHWRDHPGNLIENREKYLSQGTIVFMGLDYWAVWFYLMCRDYKSLARAYVCLGDQKSEEEIIDILKSRTRPFTRDAIKKIYGDDCVFPLFTEWFGL